MRRKNLFFSNYFEYIEEFDPYSAIPQKNTLTLLFKNFPITGKFFFKRAPQVDDETADLRCANFGLYSRIHECFIKEIIYEYFIKEITFS